MTVYVLEKLSESIINIWYCYGVVQEYSVARKWFDEDPEHRSVTEFILDQIN